MKISLFLISMKLADKIDIKSINNKLTGAKCNSVKFVSDNVICAGFDNKKVYEYNIKTKKGNDDTHSFVLISK